MWCETSRDRERPSSAKISGAGKSEKVSEATGALTRTAIGNSQEDVGSMPSKHRCRLRIGQRIVSFRRLSRKDVCLQAESTSLTGFIHLATGKVDMGMRAEYSPRLL